MYQRREQIAGTIAHEAIDEKRYSTRRKVLQGMDVYSDSYGLCGKIDVFHVDEGKLVERKREIKVIYDGYVFQVYAQYYALCDMGYEVKKISLYDMIHNKGHSIPLPHEDEAMDKKFKSLIHEIRRFDLNDKDFKANKNKCENCIYSTLCDFALC